MTNVPKSLGLIMDGNRRWAKARGLSTLEGHRAGLSKCKEIIKAGFESGVEHITLYAFSTENWKRAPEEVSYLMTLFGKAIETEFQEIAKENIRVCFIGEITRLPDALQASIQALTESTRGNMRGTLAVALSYGGRLEIVRAVNKLIQQGKDVVSEEDLSSALWTAGMRDPDLVIRTSGEQRLSNFLTWQSVYSELFFTNTFWPDFSVEELNSIFAEYAARERRHGK